MPLANPRLMGLTARLRAGNMGAGWGCYSRSTAFAAGMKKGSPQAALLYC
jgi:hypothetical protein